MNKKQNNNLINLSSSTPTSTSTSTSTSKKQIANFLVSMSQPLLTVLVLANLLQVFNKVIITYSITTP